MPFEDSDGISKLRNEKMVAAVSDSESDEETDDVAGEKYRGNVKTTRQQSKHFNSLLSVNTGILCIQWM